MATQYPEIRKFDGLYLQANSFNVPDGALEEASNVLIAKDNRITKRRGFYDYDSPINTLNNLSNYQNVLLGIFENAIGYYADTGTAPNETGTLTNNTGTAVAVTGTRVSRSIEANKNFYFTTDDGSRKLEEYDGKVYSAGVAPALDLGGLFLYPNSLASPLLSNAQVAYRVLFGRRDANDNLLLGSPSDALILTNFSFVGEAYTAAGTTVTVTTTSAHGYSTGDTVTFSNATDINADGTYTITVTAPTTFTYVVAISPANGTLDFGSNRTARLEASIPTDIDDATDGFFVQIYRSSQSNSSSATPSADYKLTDERELTAAEIAANVLYYEDNIPDILLGAELYTNPNSREGELQSNFRPPLSDDITYYKNHAVYSGVTSRHLVELDVIDTSGLADLDWIEVQVGAVVRRYIARDGVANTTTSATSVSGVGTVTITYNGHSLDAGDDIYISNVLGTVPEGIYPITNITANTFDITSSGNTATSLDFQGLRDSSGNYIFAFDNASGSVSVQLQDTAKAIIKAINRDDSAVVYASYTSGVTDIPGQMRLIGKGFSDVIELRASTTTVGEGFTPTLPTTFGDVSSSDNDQPHVFYMSKINEPEAVPLVNFFTAGARNKRLLRSVALRDSIILIKEDGVFRASGDTVQSMSITALDTTVFCLAASSVDVINNQVVFLSNQGVCLVTESSVQIISRRIEDVIQPILGRSNLSAETFGVAYESERIYMLSTLGPNTSSPNVVYVYNILNNTWTSWDQTFKGGVIDSADKLHLINDDNELLRERKFQTRIDYCGQNYVATVVSVSADKFSAVISTSGGYVPQAGDVIVKDDVFSRIDVVAADGANYNLTFARATNLLAADVEDIYTYFTSNIKLAPFHAGLVGKSKQFSQIQIHLRNNSISRLDITFAGYTYGGSKSVTWKPVTVNEGWGFEAWGFFFWGQEDGINIATNTQPAPIIRVLVPLFQQRGTFLQPVLNHKQAGESLEIQAIAFAVRAYNERVSI